MPYAVAVVFILTGFVILFIGYLIRVRGMTHLIAGYDRERVQGEEGLANLAGGCVLAMGGFAVADGVAVLVWPEALVFLTVIFTVGMLVQTAVAVRSAGRFERRSSEP